MRILLHSLVLSTPLFLVQSASAALRLSHYNFLRRPLLRLAGALCFQNHVTSVAVYDSQDDSALLQGRRKDLAVSYPDVVREAFALVPSTDLRSACCSLAVVWHVSKRKVHQSQ